MSEHRINKYRTHISDIPEDYLTLYANATAVHSDRVHACVVALAYGNKARLYNNTLRAALFKKLGIANIRDTLCILNSEVLANHYEQQIINIRKLISDLL
ncbi:MAG: hypothetical protein LBI42_11745 [Chitinispirillales bacterium]|nr:hypothetical protein [Chitinispirillales bacterium]